LATAPSTLRARRARRQRILLILAALLLVGGAAYWYLYLRKPKARIEPQPPGTIAVPVAAKQLAKGIELAGAGLIRPMYLRPELVPPAALLKTSQVQGRVTREPLRAGDYFSEENLAPTGAPPGFSGLARPGKRIVVIESTAIVGALGYIRDGDHVDVLAIAQQGTRGAARPGQSNTTIAGGGVQPGAAGAVAGGQTAGGASVGAIPAVSATLVAEGARVILVPKPGKTQFTVLEMEPQDAHVTTLAMASNQLLRFVYRPFNDESRVPRDLPRLATETRPPRDSRLVEVLNGTSRSIERTTLD
jgi:Flp pilus assembly protein CpaB